MSDIRRLIAIDPGTTESAYVVMEGSTVLAHGIVSNMAMLARITVLPDADASLAVEHMAYEMVACYGMPVGREVFETCVWIGRFIEAFRGEATPIYRTDVKSRLCHSPKAKDPNIRQALLDLYGGKEKAIGKKKTPGPLYGIHSHEWAALAVAVTFGMKELWQVDSRLCPLCPVGEALPPGAEPFSKETT